jgi:hypothetical protein
MRVFAVIFSQKAGNNDKSSRNIRKTTKNRGKNPLAFFRQISCRADYYYHSALYCFRRHLQRYLFKRKGNNAHRRG